MNQLCGNCFLPLQSIGKCKKCGYENHLGNKETSSLDAGTVLAGRYYIGRVLGVGGFSITYKAYDTVLGNIVAIKEFLPNEFATRVPTQAKVTVYSGDKEKQFRAGQERFADEAKRLAKFQCREEIVQIYDCFDENDTSYIVMEFVDGKTLKQMIKEQGKMKVEEAINIAVSILDALDEVHKIGILHRDIAPDNIMMKKDGSVKLIDFGAARYATTSHSKSLSVIIKPGYAPIEQYRSNGEQGPWTDVYGVAATLYKLITGLTPEDSMERSVKDELQRPSKMGVTINRQTENAIMNALNIPIVGRPQSAKEFKEQLLSDKVQRKKVKIRKEDLGKWPIGLKILVGALTAVIITVLILLLSGRIRYHTVGVSDFMIEEGKTRVPNIVNTNLDEAQQLVEDQKLVFLIINKEYSSEIPEGKVLLQSIDAGSIVDENSKIEITVSGGTENESKIMAEDETMVPDTQYKSEEEAVRLLEESDLVVSITYQKSDIVAEGLVISQDIDAGEIVKKGETITITVSGEEKRKVKQEMPEQPVEETPPPAPPAPPVQETPAEQEPSKPKKQPSQSSVSESSTSDGETDTDSGDDADYGDEEEWDDDLEWY